MINHNATDGLTREQRIAEAHRETHERITAAIIAAQSLPPQHMKPATLEERRTLELMYNGPIPQTALGDLRASRGQDNITGEPWTLK